MSDIFTPRCVLIVPQEVILSVPHQLAIPLGGGYSHGPLFNGENGKRRTPILRTSRTHGARRRARERRATPRWLTDAQRAEIRVIYSLCEALNRGAGRVKYKLVCGLHAPWNLRIITKLENERKGWLTWPDMPMEQLELW